MKFDTIKILWEEDSRIDNKNLGNESLKIPLLHSKYYNLLIDCKIDYKKIEVQYNKEKIRAKNYYSGDYDNDDPRYIKHGAQPKKLKTTDLEEYCKADSDLQIIKFKMFLAEEKIEFVLNILNQINSRSFQISNSIKWQKFMAGEND